MNNLWWSLFSSDGYMPHGHCYLWTPELLWMYVGSDSVIALSYYSIPVALTYFVHKRRDIQFNWIFLMFSVFIFACGTTHLISIITVWYPVYWLDAEAKVVTAAVSLATAVVLWPLIPKALRIPSVEGMQEAINRLEQEIDVRIKTQNELALLNATLEARVQERTNDLQQANLRMQNEIETRKRIEHDLYAEKERALVTVRSIADGVITTNLLGEVLTLNPVAERMSGWPEREAIGKPIETVFRLVDEKNHAPLSNPAQKILETRQLSPTPDPVLLVNRNDTIWPIEISAAPIFDINAELIGTILVFHDVGKAVQIANQMSYMAQHDALTRLPNRVLLTDRLSQSIAHAQRYGHQVGLMFLDMDHFKSINDHFGHAIGDRVLQEVGRRLLSCVRGSDTVSRLGGDEFVVLLHEVVNIHGLEEVAQKLLVATSQVMRFEEHELQVSFSIGIAVYPQDGLTIETLFKNADAAMYFAKHSGKNAYRFFNGLKPD